MGGMLMAQKKKPMTGASATGLAGMKKGGMTKDAFIKKYPNSITAQRAAGIRDHKEWDAYDRVLEYLFSTEQVESLEEAHDIMINMDTDIINDIIS